MEMLEQSQLQRPVTTGLQEPAHGYRSTCFCLPTSSGKVANCYSL